MLCVDIELPQEIFNFLQTYLPEKKMTIVEEMEKKKIVFQSESATNYETIATGQKEEKLLDTKDTMIEFRQKIDKLKIMKESGILSDEEFENEKKKLLELI